MTDHDPNVVSENGDEELISVSPNLVVIAAATGAIYREYNQANVIFRSKLGASWDLSSEIAQAFVKQIEARFRRKNKLHATFPSPTLSPAPPAIQRYIAADHTFEELSTKLLHSIVSSANTVGAKRLSESNVIFIHYKRSAELDDHGNFLVVMVKYKSGFEFDEKLQPSTLKRIDLDALLQAAMIDLTLFDVSFGQNDAKDSYLHFIEGSQTSAFFKDALGCSEATPNAESVDNLFEALERFLVAKVNDRMLEKKIREAVQGHVEKALKAKTPEQKQVKLVEVGHTVDKILPAGHESRGKFVSYANDNGFKINAVFEPTPKSYTLATTLKVTDDGKNFVCDINPDSIGLEGEGKPVTVNEEFTHLLIPLDAESSRRLRRSRRFDE